MSKMTIMATLLISKFFVSVSNIDYIYKSLIINPCTLTVLNLYLLLGFDPDP